MRILVADDDALAVGLLKGKLKEWGHEVLTASDGEEAWQALVHSDGPKVAVLDWMMPILNGVELCRRIRELKDRPPVYLIILTAKARSEDVVEGLDAGANDFITKPFHLSELRARIQVGVRMVELQNELATRLQELKQALAEAKTLRGLVPMCSYCKKIRDDSNFWLQAENYLTEHSNATFSQGVCPDCYASMVKPTIDKREDG